MIDAVSITIYAINAFGGRKHKRASVENLRDFEPAYVRRCLRALISSPASSPGRRTAAQKALGSME